MLDSEWPVNGKTINARRVVDERGLESGDILMASHRRFWRNKRKFVRHFRTFPGSHFWFCSEQNSPDIRRLYVVHDRRRTLARPQSSSSALYGREIIV